MTACPECGANDCKERFNEFLALEYSDPDHGAVHHLTVAAYMLQHSSRLTQEGWLFERQLLCELLEKGAGLAEIRRKVRGRLDGGSRSFKLKSVNARPLYNDFRWSRTILDIRRRPPGAYREDVTAWARLTLLDSQRISMERHES